MEYVLGGLLFGIGAGWLFSAFVLRPHYMPMMAPTPMPSVNQGLLGPTDYDLHQIAMASAQLEMQEKEGQRLEVEGTFEYLGPPQRWRRTSEPL